MTDDDGFLSRWSRRKAVARSGLPAEAAPVPVASRPDATPATVPQALVTPPPADVAVAPGRAAVPDAAAPAPIADAEREAEAPPPPTLADVAELTSESDFRRFVRPDVDPGVRNAAMKKLFAAPEFNVMDGLDIYIDDYSRPSPMPASMLRKMAQTAFLGLVDRPAAGSAANASVNARPDAPAGAPAAVSEPPIPPTPGEEPGAEPTRDAPAHEDTDLRLQPHDAAGPAGADPGIDPHAGRER